MNRLRAALIFSAVLVVGMAATMIAAAITEGQREERLTELTAARAAAIADATSTELNEIAVVGSSVGESVYERLPSPEEFDLTWSVFERELPGESTHTIFASVPPDELDAFLAEEAAAGAEYTPQLINPMPGPEGHILIVRAKSAGLPPGIDLSSIPQPTELLNGIPFYVQDFSNFDLMRPVTPPENQVQIMQRTEVPDNPLINSVWSAVQVDLASNLGPLVDDVDAGYGAVVETEIGAKTGAAGIRRDYASAETTQPGTSEITDFDVVVWADESVLSGTTPLRVRQIGAILTILTALLAAVALFVRSVVARADQSDLDAREDALTGLPNRRWMNERLGRVGNAPVSLLFCDIDRFKSINDRDGHSAGDGVLVAVAERLKAVCGDEADVTRFGGDEFLIVSVHRDEAGETLALAEELSARVIDAFQAPIDCPNQQYRMSVSMGVSARGFGRLISDEELIRRADVALGEAKKRDGHGLVVAFDEELKHNEERRTSLEADIEVALDTGDLTVFYQPIVDLTETTRSMETLVRWRRGDELLSPLEFLPIVAEIGRMDDLGAIVLSKALAHFAALDTPHADFTVQVNVDPSQLEDASFPTFVHGQLSEHGIAPHQLILELTEGEWLDRHDAIQPTLTRLRDIGVGLAIDDFGSGYSSLARILAIDGIVELKIDRSIIENAHSDMGQALLRGLSEITSATDLTLVAEGVSTEAEFKAVRAAGIDMFQGFHFARPQPFEDLVIRLNADAASALVVPEISG